jgi:hypothetical protein
MSRRPCKGDGISEVNLLAALSAGHVPDLISLVVGDLLRYRKTRLLDTPSLQDGTDSHV